MKLGEYVKNEDWDEVLDFIEKEYPELKETIPEFYFMLDSLLDEAEDDSSNIKIFVEGYFDEDYDVEKVDVAIRLDGATKTDFINAEVDVVITNKRCDTNAKVLAHILTHIYNNTMIKD